MRVYTVHLRRHGLIPDKDLVLLRDGFAWTAFLFTFVWALWHRMWWPAAGIFVAVAGVNLGAEALFGDGLGAMIAPLTVSAGVGFLADDLRRQHLADQGFADAGLVVAEDEEAALRRFLEEEPTLAREMAAAELQSSRQVSATRPTYRGVGS